MSATNAYGKWNGAESVHYVDHADRYDRQLAPFADAVLERVQLEPHHSVLDVGCGCGATTLTAARLARAALGADLAAPLLEVAAGLARSESVDNAEFMVAGAQTFAFAAGAFDFVISQFGLMCFDDPVAALGWTAGRACSRSKIRTRRPRYSGLVAE